MSTTPYIGVKHKGIYYKVGDKNFPDCPPHKFPLHDCNEVNGNYVCTRKQTHKGRHVACDFYHNIAAIWKRTKSLPPEIKSSETQST
jgi:hypothetical protein